MVSSFRDFEHSGWQMVADPYHDYFSPLTDQAINPLLDAVGAARSVALLDVATGPGYVAAAAVVRGSKVTGIDFSSVMIEKASRLYPEITFVEGDAEALPFDDGNFEAVAMNFGMLHLDHPERAVAEAHRVLRSGGRFAFTVWDKADRALAFGIALRAIEKHGDPKVPLPPGPPFFRFSDPQESQDVLRAAGFINIEFRQIPMVWSLPSAEDLFKAFFYGTPRTGGLLRAQSPQDLRAIEAAIVCKTNEYAADGGIRMPMASVVASGTRK